MKEELKELVNKLLVDDMPGAFDLVADHDYELYEAFISSIEKLAEDAFRIGYEKAINYY